MLLELERRKVSVRENVILSSIHRYNLIFQRGAPTPRPLRVAAPGTGAAFGSHISETRYEFVYYQKFRFKGEHSQTLLKIAIETNGLGSRILGIGPPSCPAAIFF